MIIIVTSVSASGLHQRLRYLSLIRRSIEDATVDRVPHSSREVAHPPLLNERMRNWRQDPEATYILKDSAWMTSGMVCMTRGMACMTSDMTCMTSDQRYRLYEQRPAIYGLCDQCPEIWLV